MKYIDLFFLILFSLYFRILSKFKKKSNNILVIQIVALGDIVCSSSFYRNLYSPFSNIYCVCRKKYYDIYAKNNPYVKKFLIFDDSSILGKYHFFKELYYLNITTTFDLTGSYFSKWLGFSTNSKVYGIDLRESGFNYLYTEYLENDKSVHIVESYFKLLSFYKIFDETINKELEFWENVYYDNLYQTFINSISNNKLPIISISIGANNVLRKWNYIELANVIEKLVEKYIIILLGDRNDESDGKYIEALINSDKLYNLTGKTSINEVGYIIGRSKLLISNDSGIGHIGAALNIPTLSIFGPGHYRQWRPYSKNSYIVRLNNCSPCGNNPKCQSVKCLNELKSTLVLNVINKILGENL